MSISRREALLGIAGFAIGSGVVSVAGARFREQQRQTLLAERTRITVSRIGTDGWLISEEERAAIADADAFRTSEILDVRDAVDLPGGDYQAMRVGSLGECIEACEGDENCAAFTYARASHAVEDKRRMCWLKGGQTGAPVTDTAAYVSGRRDGW